MSLHFQAATLVDSPSYPNAIAWSNENLVAVASGHLVTILNPAEPSGARALITIPACKPFRIGVIDRKDLLSGCLLPTSLTRNADCVRSISWSPVGFAPNSGCLLAVCTAQGRVKLYRVPSCEFSAECIEVTDISEIICTYAANGSFDKSTFASPVTSEEHQNQETENQNSDDDIPLSVWARSKRSLQNASTEINKSYDCRRTVIPSVRLCNSKSRGVKTLRDNELPLISAEQYAFRNAMLSSLVVAWSPIIKSSIDYSILAVGAKSGKITFWRVDRPKSYSITNSMESIDTSLMGIMQAHSSWVTTVSWSTSAPDASKPQLMLATGSSDGSVKIWQACGVELLESSGACRAPFSLIKEIMTVDNVPVSALALTMAVKKPHLLLLAIGKGSGSIEAWSCDVSTRKFDEVGTYDAHDHVVTGLAWGFHGNCLYSSGQDNSLRSWTLHENFLREASIPSNTPNVKRPTDIPLLFDSCYGVAFSPGNLVLAMVRTFDAELLNPMYQKRAMKACVEFLLVGGQQLVDSSDFCADFDIQLFPGFPERELINWERNILWSLNHHEYLDDPLVVWDVVVALLAFKQSVPKYVRHILMKWLGTHSCLVEVAESVSMLSSRLLNLINIISRRVIIEEQKACHFIVNHSDVEEMVSAEELNLWKELIERCETEVRLRLVASSFFAALSSSFWIPAGVAQMERWIALNNGCLNDNVKILKKAIKEIKRNGVACEYISEEKCSLCTSLVPFESAEVASCEGGEEKIQHKLVRCGVSMRVCPPTPLWYCISCQRRALNLAPKALFSMRRRPSDFKSFTASLSPEDWTTRPYCPYCGILLQRFLPEFLLSASPV